MPQHDSTLNRRSPKAMDEEVMGDGAADEVFILDGGLVAGEGGQQVRYALARRGLVEVAGGAETEIAVETSVTGQNGRGGVVFLLGGAIVGLTVGAEVGDTLGGLR